MSYPSAPPKELIRGCWETNYIVFRQPHYLKKDDFENLFDFIDIERIVNGN
jgi:hypothetical protein